MFGVDLTTRVKVEDAAIPNLLEKCIQYIEDSGKCCMLSFVPYVYE